jgi:hypothetical protein
MRARDAVTIRLLRSLTLHQLRSPPPLRVLSGVLVLVALFALQSKYTAAFTERARLAGPLVHAGVQRIDAMVEHAGTGRWPVPDAGPSFDAADDDREVHGRTTATGVESWQPHPSGTPVLSLDPTYGPGGIVRWTCRVRREPGGGAADPLAVPAICRE